MRTIKIKNKNTRIEMSEWETTGAFSLLGRIISIHIEATYQSLQRVCGFLYLSSFLSVWAAPLSSVKLGNLRIYNINVTTLFMRPKFSRLKIWTFIGIVERLCGLVSHKITGELVGV